MSEFLAIGVQEQFAGGWAIIPFVEKPHFWVSQGVTGSSKLWRSKCGTAIGATNKSCPPLVLGNFPKCKLCARMSKP